jgi:imidazolonepropionase-like amidohydrolase
MNSLRVLILLTIAATVSCQVCAQTSPVLVFEHANVIDGISAEPLLDVTVVVRDGKIEAIGSTAPSLPNSAQHIDITGHWMLPGLVDAHIHPFTLEGAQNMLKAGVTTGRSMLTLHYMDVGLRELHRRGDVDIPDILAAGYPIVPIPIRFKPDMTGMFIDNPSLDDLRKDIDIGVEGVRRLVRANLDHHVDVIKVFATDRAGVPTSDPRKRLLSDDELAAAVEEAHKAGVPVAAHAHGDEGAAAAVLAGVNSIEHGTYLSDKTLRLMHERNVCFTPTLAAEAMDLNPTSDSPDLVALAIRDRAMLPRARETTRHARQIGVKIIAGADSGYSPDDPHRLSDEMAELVGIGMTPMEAIQAATSRSAECLGISKRTGAIRPGLEADLIVLDANPLDDINAVRDVLLVANDGKLAVNHLKF